MATQAPSRSADYVAALRGLGTCLPPDCRLIDDPWGAEWTGVARLRRLGERSPRLARTLTRPLVGILLYLQLRTRALDDDIARFAGSDGRQLILVGAGMDARALRLADLRLKVFEIDRPASSARKRRLAGGAATYVAWDLEDDNPTEFARRLAGAGFQRAERTLAICEGVTMYLTEDANTRLFDLLRANLPKGSQVAFSYFTRPRSKASRRVVGLVRKNWGHGWRPDDLAAWLSERGFVLTANETTDALAKRLLPPQAARRLGRRGAAIAVAVIA